MTTKMKSNGDGSIKIQSQATGTGTATALREALQKQKEIYEAEGWRFTEMELEVPKNWKAFNPSPVFPNLQDVKISNIFEFIEKLKNADDRRLWRFIQTDRARFDNGELPYDWSNEKHAFEAHGWKFVYFDDASEWSAVHPEIIGVTGVNNFGRLLGIIRKNIVDFTPAAVVEQPKTENPSGEINLLDILPSPFEGQKRRRDRFTDDEISELAASIKSHGVLQPIVVRQSGETYEIIAGERRWLAARKAELVTIPAVVKNVSDEVAFEIQTIENLQRKDPDPIDEAFSYQEYIEKYGRTADDLSVKFGKPLKFIRGRLRLTKLIPEVLEDVAAGFLPLGHAFEISKLIPESQNEALEMAYDTKWENGEHVPDKSELYTLAQLRNNIEEDIFLSLKSAKFSLTATNLRDDHLPCTQCPERTGAKGSLFEDLHDPKDDRCLNALCFTGKSSRFVKIIRAEKSAEVVADGKASGGYEMPIISWMPHNRAKVEKMFGENPLVDGQYTSITNNTGECDSMEFGVFVDADGGKCGEVINICRDSSCPKHKSRLSNSSSSSNSSPSAPTEKTDDEKRDFYKRKQEIFDINVGESVRLKTLAEAAKTFGKNRWIFDEEKWRVHLVARLWNRTDDNAHRVVESALGREKYSISPGSGAIKYFIDKFTPGELSKMLFLLIVGNEGEMLWSSWRDQTPITNIAEEFGVDYALLDAKERVEAAPKKFTDAAKEHLGKIERGEKADRPVFYKLEK